MKVSMNPKLVKAAEGTENEPKNAQTPKAGEGESIVEDKFFADPFAEESSGEDVNALDEHAQLYGGGQEASSNDFVEVTVPPLATILDDPDLGITITELPEFYDILEQKYDNLKAQINESIDRLKEASIANPYFKTTYDEVIKARELAIKECAKQKAGIAPRKAGLEVTFAQELENLKAYGKEYHRWEMAKLENRAIEGGEHDGEEPTILNMPNADDEKWGLLLDNDPRIGGPDSKWVIASKEVAIPDELMDQTDKESIEVYNVLTLDNKSRPISYDSDGNPIGVGSGKDKNFNTTFSHGNLTLEDKSQYEDVDADFVFSIKSQGPNISDNGMFGAPIDITVPEYIRVDKNGKPIGIVQDGDNIIQDKATEEGDWTLERVVQVKIKNKLALNYDSTDADAEETSDHIIEFYGVDGEKLMSIRITGQGDIAASNCALSLNAGHEGDQYMRQSGINIDASSMEANADYNLADVIGTIEEKFGISDPEQSDVYDDALDQLGEGPFGILVSGFHNVAGKLTSANDIVLIEPGLDDYNTFETSSGSSEFPALYTNALKGNGGANAIFQTSGNLYADGFSFVYGGSNEDNMYINTTKKIGTENAHIYINTQNNNGRTEIGNLNDSANGMDFGIEGDDAYIIGSKPANTEFSLPYDVDVLSDEDYLKKYGEPDVDDPDKMSIDEWNGKSLADMDGIMMQTDDQISAQLKALKEQALEESDTDLDYTGVDFDIDGEYAKTKASMNIFFAGWNDHFNPDLSFSAALEDDEW
jgi:hypothetical protein